MVLRSRARSAIQPLSSLDQRLSSLVPVVDGGERLAEVVITWPISWSRSASVLVRDAVLASRLLDRAALALQHLDQVDAESLTCLGFSAWNSGWKPLNSDGQVQRRRWCGRRGSCRRRRAAVRRSRRALLQRQVAVADQVEEADLGARGGGERHVGLDPERHQRPVALVVLDLLDLADADAGDPDVVALLEHRRRR